MHRLLLMFGLLGAPLAARAEPCAAAPAVEVATLNTWGLPYPLSTHRHQRFDRIRRYLDGGPDIIALQEVWSGSLRLLSHHVRVADDGAGDSGLAVVTPHASTRPVLRPFRDASGPDRLKAKGVLTTRVDLPDGDPTWVVVTHLQAGRGDRASAVRNSQIRELIDTVAGLVGPALVMGDFNLYDDLPTDLDSVERLRGAGLRDAAELADATAPTYAGQAARLDRIYLRDGAGTALGATRVEVPRGPVLSDHAPVEATVSRCTSR